MAAITTNGSIASGPRISNEEAIRTPFTEHNQELTWLAEFLTGGETVASACVVEATLTDGENGKSQEWLWPWPREATVRSALEFVVRESDVIRLRLDTICRFVLVLCGIGNRRSREVGLLLGMSEHAVKAAYCAALQTLEVIRSQAFVDSYGCAAVCN